MLSVKDRLGDGRPEPTPAAAGASGLPPNQIGLSLTQATLLYESLPGGGTRPLSGLDPRPGGVATGGARPATASWPELPQAYNGKLALDAEGIVLLPDGSRLISDEYGPPIYRFSAAGEFIAALPVASSVRPLRNGVTDYSSNNTTVGQPVPTPGNPSFGRQNNQGFEGLSLAPDGKTLFVGPQSATRQDGGLGGTSAPRDNAQLARFGLVNGNVPGLDNLSEKWEGLVLLPALDPARPNDYFLFVANDNDFATTDGFQAGAAYNDGKNIDTMFLAYRVTIAAVPEPASLGLMLGGLAGTALWVRRRKTGARAWSRRQSQTRGPGCS